MLVNWIWACAAACVVSGDTRWPVVDQTAEQRLGGPGSARLNGQHFSPFSPPSHTCCVGRSSTWMLTALPGMEPCFSARAARVINNRSPQRHAAAYRYPAGLKGHQKEPWNDNQSIDIAANNYFQLSREWNLLFQLCVWLFTRLLAFLYISAHLHVNAYLWRWMYPIDYFWFISPPLEKENKIRY